MVTSSWIRLSSDISFGVDSIVWGRGCSWGYVDIVRVSNWGLVGVDKPFGIIVSMGMKGCVVGSSDVVGVSGSWEVLCFLVSCGSSLVSCCWSSRFRLFVRSC